MDNRGECLEGGEHDDEVVDAEYEFEEFQCKKCKRKIKKFRDEEENSITR